MEEAGSLRFIGLKKDYPHNLPVKMHSPLGGICLPLQMPHLNKTILYLFVLVSRLVKDRKKGKNTTFNRIFATTWRRLKGSGL